MTDIYEIEKIFLGLPVSPFGTIIFLVIIIGIFIFYLFINRKKIEETIEIIEEKKVEKIDYLQKIENLKNIENSKEFLKQISFIFRSFLENEKNYKNFGKMTLKDILQEKKMPEKYTNFLENIYFKEYREEEIDEENKDKLIEKIRKIVTSSKISFKGEEL